MNAPKKAFPLTWPDGWRRTQEDERGRSQFGTTKMVRVSDDYSYRSKGELTIHAGVSRVLKALKAMGYDETIMISSNLRLRMSDGLPMGKQTAPRDPGVAVYWGEGKKARCIAIDQYETVAGNLGAIAATLEAMRAIDRHGGATILDRAFTGFVALPAPEQWFTVLGVAATATAEEIDQAFRRLSMKAHPDRGGAEGAQARLNMARADGLAQLQERR